MRSLLTIADGEKCSLTDKEGKKFEELRDQADVLDIEIGRLEAIQDEERNLPGTQVDGKGVSNDELRTYILTGERRALSTAIRTTPGDCIDYDRTRDDILRDAEVFSIKLVGFYTWNATHRRTQLQGAGLDVEPFPQTYL